MSSDLLALLLSRVQFAFTVSFHIIFPAFTIGLAAWLAFLEATSVATGRPVYRRLFDFWVRIFAVAFGLGVVSVKKPQFLDRLGGNLLGLPENLNGLGVTEEDIITHLTGELRKEIELDQGVLETSNVDLSKEMTDLITAQRQYQFQSRAITMADQMGGLINGIR